MKRRRLTIAGRAALENGASRYFTGKPCKNGHVAERYAHNGMCVDCLADARRRRVESDPCAERERLKAYAAAHPEKGRARNAKWREANRARERARHKQWKADNPNYDKNKRATDIQFKLRQALRTRLYLAVKNRRRGASAIRDLGCSVEDLVAWLESKFVNGMSWENYGPVWHVDHIKPLTAFDLTDSEQCKAACHYTNLQPLLAADNIRKGGANREKEA